ncbi:hypothetical protein QBC47DRAFT_418614 [Echria macrotheca]|uniref:Ubiquitin-like protease family profile domain-containing protein n=1 Tax=Echria macrotheca TaxID=438768 RepID=A0AAJ0B333_9PEZI|nr:hypothetical protein QBC47DRAFT_418614 [Echria macrotheca]
MPPRPQRPRARSQQELLDALNSYSLHDDPNLAATVVDLWTQCKVTLPAPDDPRDVDFRAAIWAFRKLQPDVLQFLAQCLHRTTIESLDGRARDALRLLSKRTGRDPRVLLFLVTPHHADFLCDTAVRAFRVFSRKHDVDIIELLEHMQNGFDTNIKSYAPDLREHRYVLKLLQSTLQRLSPQSSASPDPPKKKRRGRAKAQVNEQASIRDLDSPPPSASRSDMGGAGSPIPEKDHDTLSDGEDDIRVEVSTPEVGRRQSTVPNRASSIEDNSIIEANSADIDLVPPPASSTLDPANFSSPAAVTSLSNEGLPPKKRPRLDSLRPAIVLEPTAARSGHGPDLSSPNPGPQSAQELSSILRCLDPDSELPAIERYLNDVVVNRAVSELITWTMGEKSNVCALDSLLPMARKLTPRGHLDIKSRLDAHDVIYLPSHDETAKHWVLFRAIRLPTISYPSQSCHGTTSSEWVLEKYDSLGVSPHRRGLDDLILCFLSDHGIVCEKVKLVPSARQPNLFDCGVYVVAFVSCLLHDLPVTFESLESTEARRRLHRNMLRPSSSPPELLVMPNPSTARLKYVEAIRRNEESRNRLGINVHEIMQSTRCLQLQHVEGRYWNLTGLRDKILSCLGSQAKTPPRPDSTAKQKRAHWASEILKTIELIQAEPEPLPQDTADWLQSMTHQATVLSRRFSSDDEAGHQQNVREMRRRAGVHVAWMLLQKQAEQELQKVVTTRRAMYSVLATFSKPSSAVDAVDLG